MFVFKFFEPGRCISVKLQWRRTLVHNISVELFPLFILVNYLSNDFIFFEVYVSLRNTIKAPMKICKYK